MAGPGGREVGRVSVRVVPDTSGFGRELMAELKEIEARTLLSIRTNLDTDQLVSEARRAVTAAERGAVVNVGSEFDAGDLSSDARRAVSEAEARAGKVEVGATFDDGGLSSEVRRSVTAAEATAGKVSITADLDAATMAADARAAVEAAEAAAGKVTIKTDLDKRGAEQAAVTLGRSINGLLATAITLGPALIPLAAGLAAAFLAVGAPLVAATAGLGAFALFAVPVIKSVTEASTELEAAQKAVTDAVTDKERKKALEELATVTKGIAPETMAAVKALDAIKDSFRFLKEALADDILLVFTAGLRLIRSALPAIGALAAAVAPALKTVADNLATAFQNTGLEGFVGFLISKAAGAILGFANGIGLIAKGFGSMLVAFDPVSKSIGGGLTSLLEKFAVIGQSAGFRQFVGYVQSVGPLVASTLGEVIRAVGALVIAFAPLGAVALVVIRAIAEGINAIPLPVLTVIVSVIVAIVAALGIANIILAVYTAILGVVAAATLAWSAATFLAGVAMAILASPIFAIILVLGLLVGGLILAWRESEAFRKIVTSAFNATKAVVAAVLSFFTKTIPETWKTVTRATDQAWEAVKTATSNAWTAVKTAVTDALTAIAAFVTALPGRLVAALSSLASALSGAASSAWESFKSTAASVMSSIVSAVAALAGRFVAALSSLRGSLAGVATSAWSSFKSAAGAGIDLALGAVRALPGQMVSALGSLGSLLFASGQSIIGGLISGIRSQVGAVKDAISSVMSAARNLLPFSPAKEGPFSGRGWTTYSGASIVDGLIEGIESRSAAAVGATSSMVGAVAGALDVGTSTVAGTTMTRQASLQDVTDRLDRLTAVVERMPRETQSIKRRK